MDGLETGVSLSEFAQERRRKNAELPAIYFTFLDASDISTILVLNETAKDKERRSWVPFKI